MQYGERAFLLVCFISFLVSLVYLLVGILFVVPVATRKERKEKTEILHDNRRTYFLRFFVMFFCPVVGPLFYFFSYLIYRLIFRSPADLDDVVFSKDRVKTQVKSDEERERDIIPLEEALFVNGDKDLRTVMINTLRGDVRGSLGTIMMALNSKDSETSHYAASLLSSELNEFRAGVQKLYRAMKEEEPEETARERELIDAMDGILRQQVFTPLEQRKLVGMLEEAVGSLYRKAPSQLNVEDYEELCLLLLSLEDYPRAEEWCMRMAGQYPHCLASYTCRLKLYFSTGRREIFFQTLSELKSSDIVIDQATLELVRVFAKEG